MIYKSAPILTPIKRSPSASLIEAKCRFLVSVRLTAMLLGFGGMMILNVIRIFG